MNTSRLRHICAAIALAASIPARAAILTAANDGVHIDAGPFGAFTLTYPALETGNGDPLEPTARSVAGGHASLTYAHGTQVEVEVAADGAVSYAFSNPPEGMRGYRMHMLIDFGFREGGTWRVGGGVATAFPREKPVKPHLFQGNNSRFTLTNFQGRSLEFAIPDSSYEEITDNREWNWKIFNWMFVAPFDRNSSRGDIKISESAGSAKPIIVVDRFGQDAGAEFPGKVKSDDELKQDAAADTAYYAGFKPPARDLYGGLPGSAADRGLTATGYFHVERDVDRWVLVDPLGDICFHMGICGFQPSDDYTYIKGRKDIYAWLPDYESEYKPAYHSDPYWSRDAFSFYIANIIRKYGSYDADLFTKRMIHRVRRFGFNAAGAFSGITKAERDEHFPWVETLPLDPGSIGGEIPGLRGLFDPFDPAVAEKMDQAFAKSVAPEANEPMLIGYFLGNEQAFEDIPRVIPSLTGGQPAKRRLVDTLRAEYGAIEALNKAWEITSQSFDALLTTGLPITTKAASADMTAYTAEFIEAYYRLIRDTFRKYDTNHMLIGNRWQPGTANNEQLCRIAGTYCEMLSLNYYTYAVDKEYLNRLYHWSGDRPFMLSEFYWSAPAESGLPGGSEVKTQRERGLAYRNYVEQAASTRFIVGIEWFILIDQARTGRWFEKYNGEMANTGLFSVTDRPYKDFLAEAARTNYGIYDVLYGRQPAFAWDDPRFQASGAGPKTATIPRLTAAIKLDGTRDGWPGNPPETVPSSHMVIGADAAGFDGTFRLAWDDDALYVLVQITDPTPMRNDQAGGALWNGDGVELFVGAESTEKSGPLLFTDRQILLGAGHDGRSYIAHAPAQSPCRMVVIPNVDGKGYTLEAAIPFDALGFRPREGQTIRFDLALDDGSGSGRQRQLMWSGGARNSADRTDWGFAKFVK